MKQWTYLKYRCGENCTIQTSMKSIMDATLLTRRTISVALNNLCNKKVIQVYHHNGYDDNINRECNIYKILEE